MVEFQLSPEDISQIADAVVAKISEQRPEAPDDGQTLRREFFSESEVAESLGVSSELLKKCRLCGEYSVARPKRPVGYTRADVERVSAHLNNPNR